MGIRIARAAGAVACATLVAATAACTSGAAAGSHAAADRTASASPAATYDATVNVDTSGRVLGTTSDHLEGLSFESKRLNSGRFDDTGNLPALLRNLGSSVIRFGGNSVDTSYHGITPRALAGLASLARASGWTVLYSEPLAHFDAAAVTHDAHSVATALGGRLAGFACGNEPDLYHVNGLRSPSYTEDAYLHQVAQCFSAIRAGAPGAMLEGPDFSGALDWLGRYAAAERGTIGWLGEHEYPLGCEVEGVPPQRLAAELLSVSLTAREDSFFGTVAAAARSAGASARLTETNSTCDGGGDGVSNTFATALWVVEYLLNGAEHGIDGMNFHGGLTGGDCEYYTPLCRTSGNDYAPQPIYYGMLFAHMLGDGQLVPVTASAASPLNLQAFALRPQGGGLRVMLENLSPYRASVKAEAGGTSATALSMTAPSLLATYGVRIGGAVVGADGTLTTGPPAPVACPRGTCQLTLAPYSATLLTVRG
ncbi:MAG: hypothetical protein J2P25_19925 [Nocardiopsaceae bacterium]|nr:hypothetical protein [Nocardiopsaceae bacterium]